MGGDKLKDPWRLSHVDTYVFQFEDANLNESDIDHWRKRMLVTAHQLIKSHIQVRVSPEIDWDALLKDSKEWTATYEDFFDSFVEPTDES